MVSINTLITHPNNEPAVVLAQALMILAENGQNHKGSAKRGLS
jgi:hypothetical protein